MNAERLLQHYEQIADAPDAIARLRRFILDLAVRGKLVPQDPTEEPIFKYLGALTEVPRRAKGVLKSLNPTDCGSPLPASWAWLPLGSIIGDMDAGWSPQCEDHPRVNDKEWGVLKTTAVQSLSFDPSQNKQLPAKLEPRPKFQALVGDILVTRAGPKNRVGVSCVVDVPTQRLMISDKLIRFHPIGNLSSRFIALSLNAGYTLSRIEDAKSGMAVMQMNISQDKLRIVPVPLPPLAEQHRIVAKVDELMVLCDELEAARTERETKRDRLVAASLARLNTPDPETFRDDARFALDALPALTARRDQIKQLRQTILNLAVRGKLVPQDPADEPAAELLERIGVQRVRLVKAGEIKRTQEPPAVADFVKPHELPETWHWVRFFDVAAIQSNLVDPRGYKEFPHIAPDNIESGTGRLLPFETIGNSGVFSAKHLFKPGCILYSKIRPALAKVVLVDFEGLCSADMYPLLPFINRQYLQKFMLADAFVRQSVTEDNRVAMPKINKEALAKILIALPPLAEQHRIVAKVDELMALCDQLESSLTSADGTRKKLLDALLAEALAPVEADALREAAE